MNPGSTLRPSSLPKNDDIAIIGLACRFPGGASDEAKLWDLLSNRKSAFSEVPQDRFNADAYYHPSASKLNTLNSRGAHFMQEDVSAFDAPFFGITAQEANSMDPAARMLLEVTFEALENAGQKLEDVAGSDTSCYVGCFTRDYHEMLYRDIESAPMYTGTGTGFSLFSNRISWFYDFRGPSMTLDTACSSSLVGLHLACRGLQAGESKMAVVCGANVILSPDIALTLSNLHMLSMDGLSRSFAEGTTGYGRGEGIAGLILKRVGDAVRDGDPIRAVIRGSGVNQDGHTKGITVPNSEAQAQLIEKVYSSAGLDPSTTGYFEAHGTGTAVGDPLELGAIAKSISRTRTVDNKLLVGSIKSNIGHLEGSAGVAGIIKCVLMLEKNAILPNIHFEKPNRRIPFEQWRIQVPTTLTPWPSPQLRRASVNSFGYGGTNAHVILDDAGSYFQMQNSNLPDSDGMVNGEETTNRHSLVNGHSNTNSSDQIVVSKSERKHLIVLSARDEAALERLRQSYNKYIREHMDRVGSVQSFHESPFLESLAHTLGYRRSVFPCRSFMTVSSLQDLADSVAAPKLSSTKATTAPRLGFVFTGQGAQWARMGLDLMDNPVFAACVQEADVYLSSNLHSKWSVLEELGKAGNESRIEHAEFSQPLSTILQIALVDLLKAWRILPSVVVGHSSGEIAAAYSFGAITKQDAWTISYWRGQLCAKLADQAPHLRGAMMAVGLGPEAVRSYVDAVAENGKVVIACVNSPSSVTLSGDEKGIDEILIALKADNIFARKLKVQNAYHSHHMQLLADEYLKALDGFVPQSQVGGVSVKMASSVTGHIIAHSELGPSYWVQNLVSPVLFSNAVETLLKQPTKGRRQARASEPAFDYLLEIGPHAALKGPLRQILQAHGASQVAYSSVLLREENGFTTALAAAGSLFCHGMSVDITAVNNIRNRPSLLTDLPPYPWNHNLKYWADSRTSRARQHRKFGRHDLLGAPAPESDDLEPRWRHFLRVSDNPWIRDHVVHSTILYPGSGILAMPLHALQQIADTSKEIESIELRDVHIVKAVVVPDDQFGLEVFLRLRRHRPHNSDWTGWWEFSVCSNEENDRVEEHGYGLGKIHYCATDENFAVFQKHMMAEKLKQAFEGANNESTTKILPEIFYAATASVGLSYGPSFQGLTHIDVCQNSCTWKLQTPDTSKLMPSEVESPHLIHPTTLDIIFHSLFAATGNGQLNMQNAAVPIGLESLTISANLLTGSNARLKGFSQVSKDADRDILADIYVANEESDTPSVVVQGLRCRELPNGKENSTLSEVVKAPVGYMVQKLDVDFIDVSQLAENISKQETAKTHGPDEELSNNVGGLDSAIATIFDLLGHKNPSFSLLQVGGVTTELTQKILSLLGADDGAKRRFASIKLIDSDRELINELTTKYRELGSTVSFTHVEAENTGLPVEVKDNPIDIALLSSQGLQGQQWTALLSNVVRILKPGGKLLIVSPKEQANEDSAQEIESAGLSSEVILNGNLEGSAKDYILSVITKERTMVNGAHNHPMIIVEPSTHSEEVTAIVSQLKAAAGSSESSAQCVIWPAQVPNLEAPPAVVSLIEFNKSVITDLSETEYNSLKALVLGAKRLLWVAKGSDPIMQTATGLLRSLGNENVNIDYSFLLLDDKEGHEPTDVAKVIKQILSMDEIEKEYIVRNGDIYCNRWAEKRELSFLCGAAEDGSDTALMVLHEAQGSLTFTGGRFDSTECPDRPLAEDEVEVDIKSLLLSTTAGQKPGHMNWREAAGMITTVGSAITCPLHPGTPVSFVFTGPISTRIRVQRQYCEVLSSDVDFEAAVLRPIIYPTVHHSLVTIAQLKSQKTVLIQGGGNILGQAAIAIAKELGATVYASVGNKEESLLLQRMGISANHLLSDNEFYHSATLMSITGGHGFDAILNTSGLEETISQLWLCMAPGGKFIDASNNDTSTSFNLSVNPFKLGASFDVVNLNEYLSSNLDLYVTIRDQAASFFAGRSLNLGQKLPAFIVDKIQEALQSAAISAGTGRTVLLFDQSVSVLVSSEVKNQLRLRTDATYVLAGGLGGLGRSLASLMVASGAKHLVFLSRSGPGSRAAESISEEFSPQDVTVRFYACDVADVESVSRAFATVSQDMSLPPIRGIIQSAAVLRDSIFENMTHTQWTEAIRPKVQGTWNLHQASLSEPCAPEGLDFFVMLASISGIVGNRGQANYAAGNSYQDALANYRRSLGLAATSVDLGLMQDIGLIAERGGQSNLSDNSVVPLTAKDFASIFKVAMNSEGRHVPAHIITGLPTGGVLQKQGIQTTPFYYRDRRFAQMAVSGIDESLTSSSSTSDHTTSIGEQLAVAASREEANTIVLKALREQVSKALRCSAEDIDAAKPMHTYGMDSLMAVDMRGWVQTKLKADISLFDVMSGGSIGMLAEKISKASKLVKADLD